MGRQWTSRFQGLWKGNGVPMEGGFGDRLKLANKSSGIIT